MNAAAVKANDHAASRTDRMPFAGPARAWAASRGRCAKWPRTCPWSRDLPERGTRESAAAGGSLTGANTRRSSATPEASRGSTGPPTRAVRRGRRVSGSGAEEVRVESADRSRDPDQDLPADSDTERDAAPGLPRDGRTFVERVRARMRRRAVGGRAPAGSSHGAAPATGGVIRRNAASLPDSERRPGPVCDQATRPSASPSTETTSSICPPSMMRGGDRAMMSPVTRTNRPRLKQSTNTS